MKNLEIMKYVLCLLALTGAGLLYYSTQTAGPEVEIVKTEETGEIQNRMPDEAEQRLDMEQPAKDIYVHVCGAVVSAGVYCLPEGARAADAIEAAGGVTDEGVPDLLNLAKTVSDGERIYIPAEGETESFFRMEEQSGDDRVNINAASKEELMTLPGIGSARAEDIIAYRTSHGEFEKPEDIMNVAGIKEAAYQKIRDKIKVQ